MFKDADVTRPIHAKGTFSGHGFAIDSA